MSRKLVLDTMKIGIKQLKKHYVPPSTAFGRAVSVGKSPLEELSLTESVIQHHQSPEIQFFRDLTFIERKLDKCEISFKNSLKPSTCPLFQEMQFYLDYLSNISASIKSKDLRLSKSIGRGLIGVERSFNKMVQRINHDKATISSLQKPQKTEVSVQTVQEKSEKVDEESEVLPELENFKQLVVGLKKIKMSRITGQLLELYESLCQMHTEIPELTAMPDPHTRDTSPEAIMLMHLNVIKNHVFHILSDPKPEPIRTSLEKSTQAEFIVSQIPEVRVLEKSIYSKDQEILKIKEKIGNFEEERFGLQDKIKKMQNFYKEVEKQQYEHEIETVHLKGKFQHSEVVIVAQEKRILWFDGKLVKKTEKLVRAKLRIDELKKIIVKKQKDMSKLQDELWDSKISWKICEEKLIDIESAWERKTGRRYEYKTIDVGVLISKYGIVKEEFEDSKEKSLMNERDSSVSDNAPPDAEEFEELIRESKEKMKEPGRVPANFKPKGPDFNKMFENFGKTEEIQGKTEDIRGKNSKKTTKNLGFEESGEELGSFKETRSNQIRKGAKKITMNSMIKDQNSSSSSLSEELIKKEDQGSHRPSLIQNKAHRNSKVKSRNKSQHAEISEQPESRISSSINPSTFHSFSTKLESSDTVKTAQTRVFSSTVQVTETFFPSKNNKKTSSVRVQELVRLEKKLTIDLERKEREFVTTFLNDQGSLFCQYKNLKNELERIRKELNIHLLSTGVQCNLLEGDKLEVVAEGGNKQKKQGKNAEWGIEGEKDPLEGIEGDEDARMLLESVFENDKALKGLSLTDKLQIVKSLKGHKKEKCKEMCPHLLRVLKIKWKSKGALYPIRNILMKSVDF